MKNVSSKGAETRIAWLEISKPGLKTHSGRMGALHRAGDRRLSRAGPGDGAHVLYPRDRGCVNVAGCSTKKTMQSILEKA